MSIQPLSPKVIAQIQSSVAITSLNDVVCELTKNALDAQCFKIKISVNYSQGSCTVEDDGHGILPAEFHDGGGLGKAYHTSKSKDGSHHGFRGAFIASLAAVAITTIASHHSNHLSTNAITLHQSRVVTRHLPCATQSLGLSATRGTKVAVHNLFGNMPVRIKQRANLSKSQSGHARQWEALRRSMVSLILAWSLPLELTMRNEETLERVILKPDDSLRTLSRIKLGINISHIHRTLSQASIISGDDKLSWMKVNASSGAIIIDGAVSLTPSPVKSSQFISIGIHPIETTGILYEEINKLFAASNFGGDEDSTDDSLVTTKDFKQRELKGGKKGIDRHPQFCLRLTTAADSPIRSQRDISDLTDSIMLSNIIDMLRVMVFAFLKKYHFQPRNRRQPSKFAQNQLSGDQDNLIDLRTSTSVKPTPEILLEHLEAPGLEMSKSSSIRRVVSTSSTITPNAQQEVFLTRMKSSSTLKIENKSDYDSITHSRPRPAPRIPSRRNSINSKEGLLPKISATMGRQGWLPFNDFAMVSLGKYEVRSDLNERKLATTETPLSAVQSDRQIWTNPITKARTLIDTSTGHTAPLPIRGADPVPQSPSKPRYMTTPTETNVGLISSCKPMPTEWLANVLKSWNNPVYSPAEQEIPQICFDGAGHSSKKVLTDHDHPFSSVDIRMLFREATDSIGGRISKDALRKSKVIAQIDKKYILVCIDHECNDPILVIIDQHAADERVRVESLLESFFTSYRGTQIVEAKSLAPPLKFDLSLLELKLLDKQQDYFARWGIIYEIVSNKHSPSKLPAHDSSKYSATTRLVVIGLPLLIHERCKQEPRLLIDLIRSELWRVDQAKLNAGDSTTSLSKSDYWLHELHTFPQGIIDMLNSRACRSAIMFNDALSISQCEILVEKLADCKFPFQCAHGRPSLIPLVDIGDLPLRLLVAGRGGKEEHFGTKFGAWKRCRTD